MIELTPQQRRLVEVAACPLTDDPYDAIENQHWHPNPYRRVARFSPTSPLFTWTQPVAWWRQQARCFDDLTIEAQTGNDPEPVCAGEEIALHMMLG